MVKEFLKMATSAALLGMVLTVPHMVLAAPTPTLHNDNPNGNFGDWYIGATPPNVDTSKPVILFVQGLHSNYTTWYNTGDNFYDKAYNAGYRTAFVQLKDSDGGGGNPWTNGPVLADVIKKVKDYYGVSKINIIAHSKGGIDTNTALAYYGAYPYVNVVHQLSTPNKGSELADLAYGSWTWWLGAIMGQQDDAVYSLQTAWMADYRAQTDSRPENGYTRTYMSGGTGNDGLFSATFWAQPFIAGENDGAVSLTSAFGLPYGVHSFTNNGSETLSHGMMAYGSKTWHQVAPKLTTATYFAVPSAQSDLSMHKAVSESSSNILRGGAVNGKVSDTFKLESGLQHAAINVMTSSEATEVTLISPSGREYKAQRGKGVQSDAVLFSEAVHNTFAVNRPEAGEWTVMAEGSNDAYFMLANLEGGAKATLTANQKVHSKNSKFVDVNVALSEGGEVVLGKNKPAKLTKANRANGKTQQLANVELTRDSKGALRATLATPAEPGVYNVSFDVTGINAAGEEFTRSVNYNFAVQDENGKL